MMLMILMRAGVMIRDAGRMGTQWERGYFLERGTGDVFGITSPGNFTCFMA